MGGWVDHAGRPVAVPEPPETSDAYLRIGAWQGGAYDRNAFTTGTEQEAGVLAELLHLARGATVLDVGCGTGRHVHALRARGVAAVGVDVALDLVAAGRAGCVGLAQRLPFADGAFAAVMTVCQGGFGLTPTADRRAVAELARVLRPGGRFALTAFSLAFIARHAAPGDAVDLSRGLHHHVAAVRGPDGHDLRVDLWTACYTPAHLRVLLEAQGLDVEGVAGVEPGAYGTAPPTFDDPELLAWGVKREAPG